MVKSIVVNELSKSITQFDIAKPKRETLRQKQSRFARMVALLIIKAHELGYEITFGDAFRDPAKMLKKYGHENSLHGIRLAIDINLFRNGKYLTSTESHRPLGEYWQSIGGDWGGDFDDGNHYALAHGGVR